MSGPAGKATKGEFMSIFQSGLSKPEMIEVNKERRTIRGHAHVIKVPSPSPSLSSSSSRLYTQKSRASLLSQG
jgi:hypothetical protein